MTTPYTLHRGDALAVLRDLPSGSVDAVITDPPYSSGGMVRGDRMASTKLKYVQTGSASHELDDFTGDNRMNGSRTVPPSGDPAPPGSPRSSKAASSSVSR